MTKKIIFPRLNDEQKKAAFCEENAVVCAGAGSGKTMVLSNRFAWLLTEKGFKVNEILALTFTKKAAAQMYGRIYSLVSKIAQTQTGIKAKRAKCALDDFIHSRIQTLDSYSASIVRQCAFRYGISPDFQIDEDRCYNLALEISYPFFISHRHHPAVERLFSGYRPNDIARKVFADILFNFCHIDKPRNFSSDIKIQFDSLCAEWKNYSELIKNILNKIEIDIFQDNALLPVLVPVMEKYKKEKIEMPESWEIRKYFDQLLNIPPDSAVEKAESHPVQKSFTAFLNLINSISAMSLRSGKRSDNPVKENIREIRSLMDFVLPLAISCMQAGFTISIMSLLSELQKLYLNRKRAEGILTFKDVANLSRTILVEQEDIRQSEKETFKAIMIDEFQDNNELQKDILFLLAERPDTVNKGIPPSEDLSAGKLFFVGDEKQSIYLFRGADVSVFRKLKEEIKSADLPLKTNFRSSAHLINAFNAIFPLVFAGSSAVSAESAITRAANSQSLPLYEAGYTPLEAGNINKEKSSLCNLSLCILNKKSEIKTEETPLSSDESEAKFVAEKIKLLIKEKYQPHEIAVLFRTRSSQYLFEKHLRTLGIPYSCEDINDLFFGGPVNDILSVLRIVSHPMDKAAYAEMLRSPFAGLTISGTAECLSVFSDETENFQPFSDRALAHLEDFDREKFLYGQRIYRKICEKAKKENISSLVSELWYNEGYRYETEWNPQTSVYRELFDYLYHLGTKADRENQGLSYFTDSMINIRNSGGKLADIEIPLERPGAVHLMTIHKSKGLEFPVVFLCGCGKRSQTDTSEIVFLSDTNGIVFSAPPPSECRRISEKRNNFFWEQSSEEIKRKRTAELRRLLYVGMTRAEKDLYITGSLEIKNPDETENFSLLLKKFIEDKCKNTANYIEGDLIINNDTLFGLLLPAIAGHIPNDGLGTGSFFRLEEIPRLSEEYIKEEESKNTKVRNSQKALDDFLQNAELYYKKAEIIKTPVLHDNHITAVSLKENIADNGDENLSATSKFVNLGFSGKTCDDIFKNVDATLLRFSQNTDETSEKLNSGSFGTIAHICVEAQLNNTEAVIPSNISGLLSPPEMTDLLEAGKELAKRFVLSPLGKIAETAKLRESEFSFRSLLKNRKGKEIFINGTVDLFFEDKETIHIVDFKTDSSEKPGEHTAQMSCYYHAICALFAVPLKKQCRIWLYYLRTGHAVEMTEKAKHFNLENRAFL